MLYKNQYSFLSNMCGLGTTVEINGLFVRSVENYYQAMKTENQHMRNFITTLNPYEAKRVSKELGLSEEFLSNIIQIMKDALNIKFNIPLFKYLLLSTKDTKLVEENYWKDTFWGVCDGIGENNLGKLQMEKRQELRKLADIKSKIKLGNVYNKNVMDKYDYIGFTANSTLNKMGELVMGAGTALTVKELYPELPKFFGEEMKKGNVHFMVNKANKIFSFRTKEHWKDNSKLEYIETSLHFLKEFANKNKTKRFVLPVPGILNGGLQLDDVLPLFLDLPKNIDLWMSPKTMCYTGIGSRTLPEEYRVRIETISKLCSEKGYCLRSGGADGSDLEFEKYATKKEIYIPWKDFNNSSSQLFNQPTMASVFGFLHHPGYENLKEPVKKLMDRNVLQVLGLNLTTPSDFVVVFTGDGCKHYKTRTNKTGGSGQAISLASSIGVPIYNVKNDEDYNDLLLQLNSI